VLLLIQHHFVINLSNNATRTGDMKKHTGSDKIQNYEKMFLCGSSMDWVIAII